MKKVLVGAGVWAMPMLALAQASNINSVLSLITSVLNAIVPIIIALAVVWFLWGVFQYVIASDPEEKTGARNHMIWGIIGIFVMVSVWGLVNLLRDSFNLNNNVILPPTIPTLNVTTNH